MREEAWKVLKDPGGVHFNPVFSIYWLCSNCYYSELPLSITSASYKNGVGIKYHVYSCSAAAS